MRNWIRSGLVAAGVLLAIGAQAQTPSPAPSSAPASAPSSGGATVTATCKDGTPFSGTSLRGACRGHGGVEKEKGSTPHAASSGGATSASTSGTATPPATSGGSASSSSSKKKGPQPLAEAKPGGGPGLVWVNTDSKTYHCNGSRWYGRTKSGEYMSESAAKTAGFHAAQNKACTS